MAKYAVIFSVIFSLFLLTHARVPSNEPSDALPDFFGVAATPKDGQKTHHLLLLPSDEGDDSKTAVSDTLAAIGIPRPFVGRFRPVNRRFPRPDDRRSFPFRFPHNCRHHHHNNNHHRVQIPHEFEGKRQISYGNDMIGNERRQIPYENDMISEEGGQIPYGDDMIGTDGRRIPARGFGFGGERPGGKEESGFMRWFQGLFNRF